MSIMFLFDSNYNDLIKKSQTKTLGELNRLKDENIDNDDLFQPIEYVEGSSEDDTFILLEEVINPQNYQHTISAWIPLEMAKEVYFDYLTADTDSYYNWTSAYANSVKNENFNTEQEALDCATKFINTLRNEMFHGEFNFTASVKVNEYDYKGSVIYCPEIEFSYI